MAQRKRALTEESSSRWAGSITKATHGQWALGRHGRLAHIQGLEAGIATITHRLSLPVGEKGCKRAPGGYRSRQEWFAKTRRLHVPADRLEAARADREAGVVHVVRGGKRLPNTRHHLDAAQLTEEQWRTRWQVGRRFLQADDRQTRPGTPDPAGGTSQARPGTPGREALPNSGLRPRAGPAFPDHGHDPRAPDAERTRATRTPDTVRGTELSTSSGNRTHSHSVFRNGSETCILHYTVSDDRLAMRRTHGDDEHHVTSAPVTPTAA